MRKYKLIILIIVFNTAIGFSQEKLMPLTTSEKSETIDSVKKILIENYIFTDITDKVVKLLDSNFRQGNYSHIQDPVEFANTITNDIQSFNHDTHLRLLYEPEIIKEKKAVISVEDSIAFEQEYVAEMKRNNYSFKEVKILEGNVGYLDLRKFRDPKYAGETAVATMNFLSNSDAIIIDLRNNGGGTPKMVQLISSYFFGDEVVLLNSVYKRKENITKQFWTLPYVPGKKMSNVPLYILTSERTFSAAEEFCYNLQNLKRAIVIGEITGGGAHPGGRIKATERYNVWTPTSRSINPITNTNWENVGIIPEIKVSENDALKTAYIIALDSLKNTNIDTEKYYDNILETLK